MFALYILQYSWALFNFDPVNISFFKLQAKGGIKMETSQAFLFIYSYIRKIQRKYLQNSPPPKKNKAWMRNTNYKNWFNSNKPNLLIGFHSISTHPGLLYAWRLRNHVHCMFIFTFLCSYFLRVFFFLFLHKVISN